jgi:thiosulfate reductase cytochrome b subunit
MNLEVIYYTLVATGLYFMSDWILDRIEVSRGERFKNRSIIFFLIILTLAFISFSLMKYLLLTSEVASQ